jgi:hypothetical protein
MRKIQLLAFAIAAATGAVYAEGGKSFKNNNLEITVVQGDVFVPFKDGKGFRTYKVTAVNTNAAEGRTLNAQIVMKGGGAQIGSCQVFIALDAGATESKDINCKHTAENIEEFDLKITKVYNKKM